MNKEEISKAVENFRSLYGFGRSINDAFVPWWISLRFGVEPSIAMSCSSDGNNDFGVDGFFIEKQNTFVTAYFIQGKYTSDINQIKTGITDFAKIRFINRLNDLLKMNELDNPNANPVIIKLYNEFNKLGDIKNINVKFIVISLSEEGPEFLNKRLSNARKESLKEIQSLIGNSAEVSDISVLTLDNIIAEKATVTKEQVDTLHFDGSDPIKMNGSLFYSGIGRLSDLVDLLKDYGNVLFERNVRYFLFGKRNEEHGPAGKIKETLRDICITQEYLPTRFAFLHNGITIFADTANIINQDNKVELRKPCVLNGCQTIKAAYYFYQSKKESNKFNEEIWKSVPITLRIIVSRDNKLWRDVAESNNRQNALKPSALKANDEIQIIMEHEFKKIKIFYERQEGAFKNIATTSPVLIASEYQGSTKEPVKLEKLARAMLLASDLPLYLNNSMAAVFETDDWYNNIFNTKTAIDSNMPYFVLLSNIQKVIHLSLQEIVNDSGENGKYTTMDISKYQATIFRLLMKVIDAKSQRDSLMDDYGFTVISSNNSNEAVNLRELIKTILRSKEYPIMLTVAEVYKKENEWSEPYDTPMNQKCQKKLGIENIKCLGI